MSLFKTVDFDSNAETDATFKDLFKAKQKKNKKHKILNKNSKIAKKSIKKVSTRYLRKKIQIILSDNPDSVLKKTPKVIKKNNRIKQEQQETKPRLNYKQKKTLKMKEKLKETIITTTIKKKKPNLSLRGRMMERLKAARFRYLNEQIYSNDSKQAQKLFREDPDAFNAYHEGYRQQVRKWPLNPLEVIIKDIEKMPKSFVIADFGCGEAKLAKTITNKVHSFDLVARDDAVTACDMAHVPIGHGSVDVAVFCLSLMGTNLQDYILEANRVLKEGGLLKIAEVESRFDDVKQFVQGVERFHFKNTRKDLSHKLFYFLEFRKESNIKKKQKLPTLSLHPCLYKKR